MSPTTAITESLRGGAAKEPRLCVLVDAAGRIEECPGEGCPFWEPGGAVLEVRCALERMLPREDWTAELAERWLRLRSRFADAARRY